MRGWYIIGGDRQVAIPQVVTNSRWSTSDHLSHIWKSYNRKRKGPSYLFSPTTTASILTDPNDWAIVDTHYVLHMHARSSALVHSKQVWRNLSWKIALTNYYLCWRHQFHHLVWIVDIAYFICWRIHFNLQGSLRKCFEILLEHKSADKTPFHEVCT